MKVSDESWGAAVDSSRPTANSLQMKSQKSKVECPTQPHLAGNKLRPDQRIVARLPLKEIWDEKGALPGGRLRFLDKNLIAELLRMGRVQFLVANLGDHLKWISTHQRFQHWNKIKGRIAEHDRPILLHEFPGQTAYLASEWRGRNNEVLILLEAIH